MKQITTEDILQHVGIKGMKWGVRRSNTGNSRKGLLVTKTKPKRSNEGDSRKGLLVTKTKASVAAKAVASKSKDNAVVNRIKEEVKSAKREASWSKIKVDGMSTSDIQKVARRAQMENDLKRMSKLKNVGNSKDRASYRKRESMSDDQLMETVSRLRAKESFDRNVNAASKSQRQLGRKVLDAAGPLAVSYALTGKVGPKDVITAVQTLQKKSDSAIEPGQLKNEIFKTISGGVVQKKQSQIYEKMGLNPDGSLKD